MSTYPIKYIEDKDGNRVLPKTAVSAVVDEQGTPLSTLLAGVGVPDEEDLTKGNDGKVRFKDRPNTSGMGKVILRKNMVSGVNTLTQSMMQATNTIYVIRYDFTLGEDITVPENCVLEFEGGSITANGNNDTITGNNTVISSNLVRIFSNIILGGSFVETKFYLDYFGNGDDWSLNYKEAVKAIVNVDQNAPIHLANRTYDFKTQIDLNQLFTYQAHITLYGEGRGSKINILYGSSTYSGDISTVDYLFIRDMPGSGWQNLVTISLANVFITTPDIDSNRGFLYIPTAWTNDTYIIGVKTANLACVFNIYRAYWFRINQCTFSGGHTQLRVYDCNSSSVTNCQFRGSSSVDGMAIHCTGSHGFNISGNDFSDHHIALKIDGPLNENINITGNYFEVGSSTQQNYEIILNDSGTTQECNQIVISNNAGIHTVSRYSSGTYQYYGVVCNGRVINSVFNCAIGDWNAEGYNNIGQIFIGPNVDTDRLKSHFTTYTTFSDYINSALFPQNVIWDARELDKRIEQLAISQENIIRALLNANITFKNETIFEENGKIMIYGGISYNWFFRNDHPNTTKIFSFYPSSDRTGGDMFYNCPDIEYIADFDGSQFTSARNMFNSASSLVQAPYFNTENITDCSGMFQGCIKLKYVPNYNTSNVTDISYMFFNCASLETIPAFDFSKVTSTDSAFTGCSFLKNVGGFKGLSKDTSLQNSMCLTMQSVINIANSIYDWSVNPDSKETPSSTPTITFNKKVYDNITDNIMQLFTNKGWNVSSFG